MTLNIFKLTKKYKDFTALNNFSFEFQNGVYAILGPNGAGKTTLINMMVLLSDSTEGEIFFNGENIKSDEKSYLKSLGYMPQDIQFYDNYTPREILKYIAALKGIKIKNRPILDLLIKVNLQDVEKKKIKTFSCGMKQRLGIAQTFINDPPIMIFDEPTAGLDPKERIRFKNLVSNYNNRIIIIATHIISDIENIAKKILILKNGKIVAVGSQKELMDNISEFVWSAQVSDDELVFLSNKYLISKVMRFDDFINVKIISEQQPDCNCSLTIPDMEDVYLYYTEYVKYDSDF